MSAPLRTRLFPAGRLLGIDAARGLALFAMVATHVFALLGSNGEPTLAAQFAGRASALFAVLAGYSLILATRRWNPHDPRTLPAKVASGRVAVRGVAIVVLGLTLGMVGQQLAIILVNYGLLFLIAIPFLRLSVRALAVIVPAWCVLSPLLSTLVRSHWELSTQYINPSWWDLGRPAALVQDLVLTGYYPLLQWLGYILLGILLAKLNLTAQRTTAWLVFIAGTVIGLGTLAASRWWVATAGAARLTELAETAGISLNDVVYSGNYGIVPADSWWWLLVAGPHTGTPVDMIHTGGVAAAVIAGCVLLAQALKDTAWVLAPLAIPGSMPLTVYSAHVVSYQLVTLTGFSPAGQYLTHVLSAIVFACGWKVCVSPRGPLEWLLARLSQAVVPNRGERVLN